MKGSWTHVPTSDVEDDGRSARAAAFNDHVTHFRNKVRDGNTLSALGNDTVFHTDKQNECVGTRACEGATVGMWLSKAFTVWVSGMFRLSTHPLLRPLAVKCFEYLTKNREKELAFPARMNWVFGEGHDEGVAQLLAHTEVCFLFSTAPCGTNRRSDNLKLVSWCDVCKSCTLALQVVCGGNVRTFTFQAFGTSEQTGMRTVSGVALLVSDLAITMPIKKTDKYAKEKIRKIKKMYPETGQNPYEVLRNKRK
jgi:hypothetical protein